MTDGIGFDFSELDTLAADLGDAPNVAGKKVRQAIEVSARNVKDAWAKKLDGENALPHAPRSITYDIEASPGNEKSTIEAEIGAETVRLQAPIVTVIEFGAPGKNLAPRGYGLAALEETAPDFQRGLEIATEIL